ncbi:cullin 3 [Prunus dulcis]|uniref:Cullin 3 n=1 Tax=Prunus dulcis TaxID=3755 RepID=A0A4Y1QQX8_PRUDU|nr:cullin 3 [Prunus dulcis]
MHTTVEIELWLPEMRTRGIIGALLKSFGPSEHGTRLVRKGRRLGRFVRHKFWLWMFLFATIFLIYLLLFGLNMHFPAKLEGSGTSIRISARQEILPFHVVGRPPRSKHHLPCEVGFLESVEYLVEPKEVMNFTQFSLEFIDQEGIPSHSNIYEPRFGGHQILEEREQSFFAKNQTLHCGFIKGPPGFSSTGFDIDAKDKAYMNECKIAVSSCIFGSSDFLRRPTSKKISEYSKKNVCFVMFVDEQTLGKLSSEGHVPDVTGRIGLWRIVIVKNLPYEDMRRTGKVPKFLSHRLFPHSWYSIWLDSKMRLNTDPMLIIEYFLWRTKSEYAISNHYERHCVSEEVLQNKRLDKFNHTAIDEQFAFYQSDGLTKFTSRDQLSFAYTYLKLRRMNPDRPFYLSMFKDCERRALVKLFRHREEPSPPGPPPGWRLK